LRRTSKYASLLWISGALHLAIFEQSGKNDFFSKLLGSSRLKAKGRRQPTIPSPLGGEAQGEE